MTTTSSDLNIDYKKYETINFKIVVYGLHAVIVDTLKHKTADIASELGKPVFRGPIMAIIQELVANGLKAIYKQIYFETIIPLLEIPNISYESKLNLFRCEIKDHQTKHLANEAKLQSLFVTISCQSTKDGVELLVENPGLPTEIEKNRIEKSLESAKKLSNLNFFFEDNDDNHAHKEGAGLGISLLIMTLRNMGVNLNNLNYLYPSSNTVVRVLLPWRIFFTDSNSYVRIMNHEPSYNETVANLIHNLSYYTLIFDNSENILQVSENFLKAFNLSDQKEDIKNFIPKKFFEDIFHGSQSIHVNERFANYRIWINIDKLDNFTNLPPIVQHNNNKYAILLNISGVLNSDATISTLWSPVMIKDINDINYDSESTIQEAIQVQQIIKPYLSERILQKAHEAVKNGEKHILEEVKHLTIFFADVVGFTSQSENSTPNSVIQLLNIVLSILVKSIDNSKGHIDKFMGDAIMAIFEDPLDAVIAGIEAQHLFYELNELRKLTGETPIQIRIGIHTGNVIVGNIGTTTRKDWTVIGDVVNTASRLEKNGVSGAVVISEDTYELVKDAVQYSQKGVLVAKGKKKKINIYLADGAVFFRNGHKRYIKIKDRD